MKLVTFSIYKKKKFNHSVSNIHQAIHTATINLYQLETVPVLVIDKNTKADTYTQLQITKPYTALNTKTYINIRQQESVICRKIGYEFYC